MSFIRALIVLHRTYRHRGARTRLHVLIRFLTCPFLRLLAAIPRDARVLDVGAGHGLFPRLLAARGNPRPAGIEPDTRKVQPVDGVALILGYDDCIRGRFDAVTFVDVLYRFPINEWDDVLARCRARLRPGGMIVIKEHDPTVKIKNGWNHVQEWFTDKVKLTLGESFAYEAPRDFLARLERLGFVDAKARRIDFGYPHPHIVYTARLI